jgi:1-acyl-sn-glycerol-3-phosphate acyltransferase
MSRLRLARRTAAILGLLLAYLPLHYGWKVAGRRSRWPRRFLGGVGRSAGLRPRIVGTPLPSHVLFAANHLSWLDIMIVADATGAAFVSKDEVARWPVIGWLAGLNDTIFIARADRRSVRGQADTLRAALATGRPVALFPEGTTGGGEQVLPFRASLFAALLPPLPGLKLQPIAIDYGAAAGEIAWTGDEGAGANAKRVLSRQGTAPVTLHFLEPLDPSEWPDRKALAEAARIRIIEALGASAAGANLL